MVTKLNTISLWEVIILSYRTSDSFVTILKLSKTDT